VSSRRLVEAEPAEHWYEPLDVGDRVVVRSVFFEGFRMLCRRLLVVPETWATKTPL
jgi:hypothetical protein